MRALLVVVAVVICGCPPPSGTGDACGADAGCPAPLTCDTTQPGGYCTRRCPTPGMVAGCGGADLSDAVCAVIDGGAFCADVCGSGGCRAGYTCRMTDGGAASRLGDTGVCLAP